MDIDMVFLPFSSTILPKDIFGQLSGHEKLLACENEVKLIQGNAEK
jgi:hypothetical protein